MKPILQTFDLVKYFQAGENVVRAVDHTNLEIKRGVFTAIIGRSGSGKSTLLHLLGGLDTPTSGRVLIEGADLYSMNENQLAQFRRRKIGFIFQEYNLIKSLNVWENIVLPIGLDGRKTDKEDINRIIRDVGLEEKRQTRVDRLSGGQMQRVAVARALAAKPALILADEPTGGVKLVAQQS